MVLPNQLSKFQHGKKDPEPWNYLSLFLIILKILILHGKIFSLDLIQYLTKRDIHHFSRAASASLMVPTF